MPFPGLKMDELRDLRGSIQQLAEKYGKSMAQICVNWAICHNAIPLVGIRSLDQARDAVGALGWKLEQDVEALVGHVGHGGNFLLTTTGSLYIYNMYILYL